MVNESQKGDLERSRVSVGVDGANNSVGDVGYIRQINLIVVNFTSTFSAVMKTFWQNIGWLIMALHYSTSSYVIVAVIVPITDSEISLGFHATQGCALNHRSGRLPSFTPRPILFMATSDIHGTKLSQFHLDTLTHYMSLLPLSGQSNPPPFLSDACPPHRCTHRIYYQPIRRISSSGPCVSHLCKMGCAQRTIYPS